MELRHLRYFVAVAESLHFGVAASRLRISQPSLSQQIRQLEEEIQTSLLRRTKRRVELTEAGELFLEEARDIIARSDRAAMIARRVGRGHGGRIRVGVGYCMNQRALVKAVGMFRASHPKVRVELQTMAVTLQLAALRDERLDVAFVRGAATDGSVESQVVHAEELVLALPPRHRFAHKRVITVSSLAQESFVVTSREHVPVYHDIVLKTCREAGFIPNAPHEADHLQMILDFVAAGCAVALVPAFVQRHRPRRVAFASLRPASPPLETVAAWRRSNSSAMLTEFVTFARRALLPAGQRFPTRSRSSAAI
jgi:DNA-binding transcriptional LysR family regulator